MELRIPERLGALELLNPRRAAGQRLLPRNDEEPTRAGVKSSNSPNMASKLEDADREVLRFLAEEDLGPADTPRCTKSHMDLLEEVISST